MSYSLVIKNALIQDGKPLVDIGIEKGKISKIGSNLEGEQVIDVNGDAVVPTFIEMHIHLDKALLERVKPNPSSIWGRNTMSMSGSMRILAMMLRT